MEIQKHLKEKNNLLNHSLRSYADQSVEEQ